QSAIIRAALRSPVFWAILVSFTAYSAALTALTFHFVPLLGEFGVPAAAAVAAFAVVGPAQVVGRFLLAGLGGRIGARGAGRIVVLLFPLATAMLLPGWTSWAWLAAFAALYGLANGIMTIVRSTAVPDLLTRQAYGTLNGLIGLP